MRTRSNSPIALLLLFLIIQTALAWTSIRFKTTRRSDSFLTATLNGHEIFSPYTPTSNNLLVQLHTEPKTSIIVPNQAKPTQGIVLASGPGRVDPLTAERIPSIQKGTSVIFGRFNGVPVIYNEQDCVVLSYDDVLASWEGKQRLSLDTLSLPKDHVLIELDPDCESLTTSGLVVPTTQRDSTVTGTVVNMGAAAEAATSINIGDRVKFRDYGGNDIRMDDSDKKYSVVKMANMLCTMHA